MCPYDKPKDHYTVPLLKPILTLSPIRHGAYELPKEKASKSYCKRAQPSGLG